MEYEMKSILRSKASLVCLLIFLIVNMFSMNFLNLENDVERNIIHNEQLIVESQNSISQIDVIKKQLSEKDRKSTRLNSSHANESRMPSSA